MKILQAASSPTSILILVGNFLLLSYCIVPNIVHAKPSIKDKIYLFNPSLLDMHNPISPQCVDISKAKSIDNVFVTKMPIPSCQMYLWKKKILLIDVKGDAKKSRRPTKKIIFWYWNTDSLTRMISLAFGYKFLHFWNTIKPILIGRIDFIT